MARRTCSSYLIRHFAVARLLLSWICCIDLANLKRPQLGPECCTWYVDCVYSQHLRHNSHRLQHVRVVEQPHRPAVGLVVQHRENSSHEERVGGAPKERVVEGPHLREDPPLLGRHRPPPAVCHAGHWGDRALWLSVAAPGVHEIREQLIDIVGAVGGQI
eukprot:3518828-Pyramimonas_sp.AAC.1